LAKSIDQIQRQYISEPNFDRLGGSSTDFISISEAPTTKKVLVEVVGNFILAVQANVKRLNKVDTGKLETGGSEGKLVDNGGDYSIRAGYESSHPAAKYASFVNQGVQGFKSKQPADSPFKFKSAFPAPDGVMVVAIQKWIKRNAIASRREDQRENLSALQQKRKSVAELNTGRQTAFLIAAKIKQRGLPKTNFFTDQVEQYFGRDFALAMGKAFLQDVQVYMKQFIDPINESNK
jgi:hypothetical protein